MVGRPVPLPLPPAGFELAAEPGSISSAARELIEAYVETVAEGSRLSLRSRIEDSVRRGAQWIMASELPAILLRLPPLPDTVYNQIHDGHFADVPGSAAGFLTAFGRRWIVLNPQIKDNVHLLGQSIEEEMAHLLQLDEARKANRTEDFFDNWGLRDRSRMYAQTFLVEFGGKRIREENTTGTLNQFTNLRLVQELHSYAEGDEAMAYVGYVALARAVARASRKENTPWYDLDGKSLLRMWVEVASNPDIQRELLAKELRTQDDVHGVFHDILLKRDLYDLQRAFTPYLRQIFSQKRFKKVAMALVRDVLEKLEKSPSDYYENALLVFNGFMSSGYLRAELQDEFDRTLECFANRYPFYMESRLSHLSFAKVILNSSDLDEVLKLMSIARDRDTDRFSWNVKPALIDALRTRPAWLRGGLSYLHAHGESISSLVTHDLRFRGVRDPSGEKSSSRASFNEMISLMMEEGSDLAMGILDGLEYSFDADPERVAEAYIRAVRVHSGPALARAFEGLESFESYFLVVAEGVSEARKKAIHDKIFDFLEQTAREANDPEKREGAQAALATLRGR